MNEKNERSYTSRMLAVAGARIRVAVDASIAPNVALIVDADDYGAQAWVTLSPSDCVALAKLLGAAAPADAALSSTGGADVDEAFGGRAGR